MGPLSLPHSAVRQCQVRPAREEVRSYCCPDAKHCLTPIDPPKACGATAPCATGQTKMRERGSGVRAAHRLPGHLLLPSTASRRSRPERSATRPRRPPAPPARPAARYVPRRRPSDHTQLTERNSGVVRAAGADGRRQPSRGRRQPAHYGPLQRDPVRLPSERERRRAHAARTRACRCADQHSGQPSTRLQTLHPS